MKALMRDTSEEHVERLLASYGFAVARIPRAHGRRTSDFRVSDGRHRYTVEATEKAPEQRYREYEREADRGGAPTLVREMDQ